MKPLPLILLAGLLLASPAIASEPSIAAAPPGSARFELPATDDGLPGSGPIRRYDWFRQLWTERRSKWSTQVEADQGALVFLGDSITQGWGDHLGENFPDLKVANRGISGDTTRGVLVRLQEDVLALKPSGVVLLIGTNDLEERANAWSTIQNMDLLLRTLKSHNPSMPVIVCQIFPSSAKKERPTGKIRRLNTLLRELMKEHPQATLLDTWTLFADTEGNAKPEEFPDLLHPNAAGYAKWAAALRPLLATHGFVENESEPFTPEPGFVSLFNGSDLTGWGYRPSSAADEMSAKGWYASDPDAAEWPILKTAVNFDGMTVSPDGRFVAKHGRLIVTTPSAYRKVQQLWTTREFPKNFVLKLEFRATPNADSGVYVRGPQLQCRDYSLAGPYKQLAGYKPQDWNELTITVKDGTAHCICNGEVIESAMPVPATGPVGVEGDCGQMEYRRIRLQELP